MSRPFFSIVTPMYNRAAFIGRALQSCLNQSFGDFEVIVVDDASTDGSFDAARAFDDPRIRLRRHDVNRGRCPARNTGMSAAAGEWLVFLDSDDELLPDGLETIYKRARDARQDVAGLRFMCVDEKGDVSPRPPLQDQVWGYTGYLKWLESMRNCPAETLPCTRASTFPRICYPDDHSEEGLYHLDIARAGGVMACSDVVRCYRHDAGNRVTAPDTRRSLAYAPAAARNIEVTLQRHGAALRAHAPGVFRDLLRGGALFSFLDGKRKAGLRYSWRYVIDSPRSARILPIVGAGLLGRRFLAWLQHAKSRLEYGW